MIYRILLFSLCFTLSLAAQSQLPHPEEAGVREALMNYINGRNQGKPEVLAEAFHPKADLRHIKNDSLRIWPAMDYVQAMSGGKVQDCKARIVYTDITGDAAQAKIELEYPNKIYADYLNLLKIEGKWQVAVKTFSGQPITKKVLFVVTSHEQMGDTGRKTGLHLGEVSHVYKPLHDAGYTIDIMSPKGGQTFMYGTDMNDANNVWFMQNPTAYHKLTHTLKPAEVKAEEYAAIYFVGGHGTMWDLPENKEIASIATVIYEKNGVLAAVCHGPAGIVNLKLSNGKYLVSGKQLTSFTDEEERATGQAEVVPFLLETQLREHGGKFSGADNWQENVVVDGRLITGQNPASAGKLAQAIIQQLEAESALSEKK